MPEDRENMRLKIVAANWKMNKTNPEAVHLAAELAREIGHSDKPLTVLCPPFTALSAVANILKGTKIALGAQNMFGRPAGAFTGEIAPSMLLTIGVTYVILGHSERREYFFETDEIVNEKVKLAQKSGLIPIVCVGEKLDDRESGKTMEVVSRQIRGSLKDLSADDMKKLVIAYEPVWAIGTGRTATPEVAQETHALLRQEVVDAFGASSRDVPILYGGSVKGDNAAPLLSQPDIDGALVGGASLDAADFARIVRSA
jgi:triosephosphate isomerase